MSSFDAPNPFQSPLSDEKLATQPESDAERVRQEHLSLEASIQSMGLLYYIGAILFGIYCLVLFVALIAALFKSNNAVDPILVLSFAALVALAGAVAYLNFWVGRGLRKLDIRVRTPAIVLSVIGLIGIPIGTIISGYFLWLLLSAKGKYVLSPEYQSVIEQTPHIKYKTSIIVWIFLGILLVIIGLGVIGGIVLSVVESR